MHSDIVIKGHDDKYIYNLWSLLIYCMLINMHDCSNLIVIVKYLNS